MLNNSNLVLRACNVNDIDKLIKLLHEDLHFLTSLPKEKNLLEEQLKNSCNSFSKLPFFEADAIFILILENINNASIIGIGLIKPNSKHDDTLFSFLISTITKEFDPLKILKKFTFLNLCQHRNNALEIDSIYLHPEYANQKLSTFLLQGIFHFIFLFKKYFKNTLFVPTRGVGTLNEQSPFYEQVCKPFFLLNFEQAFVKFKENKAFINDLGPKNPIILELLPLSVQKAFKTPHSSFEIFYNTFLNQGFFLSNYVNLIDGGPNLYANIEDIKMIKSIKPINGLHFEQNVSHVKQGILSNCDKEFRACMTVSLENQKDLYSVKQYLDLLNTSQAAPLLFSLLEL